MSSISGLHYLSFIRHQLDYYSRGRGSSKPVRPSPVQNTAVTCVTLHKIMSASAASTIPTKSTTSLLTSLPCHVHEQSTPSRPYLAAARSPSLRNFSYPLSVTPRRPATPPSPSRELSSASWNTVADQLTPLSIRGETEKVENAPTRPYVG